MQSKRLKPEDKITVEITLAELARVYAVMGKVDGGIGDTIWQKAKEILDPRREIYNGMMLGSPAEHVLKYTHYCREWERALFHRETEQQKQIRELKETIQKAQQQIEELEGVV